MGIWKLISLLRLFLLLLMVALLINNGNFIEGGLLAVYILLDIVMRRLGEVEKMLREVKELKRD